MLSKTPATFDIPSLREAREDITTFMIIKEQERTIPGEGFGVNALAAQSETGLRIIMRSEVWRQYVCNAQAAQCLILRCITYNLNWITTSWLQ